MERFLLFAFDQYYPRGGIGDLYGDYESEELAREQWDDMNQDYGHILDTETHEIWNLYRR